MNDAEPLAPPPAPPPREPKIIKRYTNRKLYDTVESRYVTLDEIARTTSVNWRRLVGLVCGAPVG